MDWPIAGLCRLLRNAFDVLQQGAGRLSTFCGFHPLMRHQRADWTDEEIAEVARVIESRHGPMNDATARRKYGVYLPSERLSSHFRTMVSDETHETLMATLDQSVAATSDQKKRFGLLQDKIMFCLFRFTNLSTAAIHELKLSDMGAFAVKSGKSDGHMPLIALKTRS